MASVWDSAELQPTVTSKPQSSAVAPSEQEQPNAPMPNPDQDQVEQSPDEPSAPMPGPDQDQGARAPNNSSEEHSEEPSAPNQDQGGWEHRFKLSRSENTTIAITPVSAISVKNEVNSVEDKSKTIHGTPSRTPLGMLHALQNMARNSPATPLKQSWKKPKIRNHERPNQCQF